MNILLIADTYLSLYKEIKDELINEGHNVTCIKQRAFHNDPYIRTRIPIYNKLRQLYWKHTKVFRNYWETKLNDGIVDIKYDLLFVIQGYTFDPIIITKLRENNSNIKTVLYIWDTNKSYNFFRNIIFFDKTYSFDIYDVQHFGHGKVSFLPFFWPTKIISLNQEPIYDICSIGTNHHDRYIIYRKVLNQLEKEHRLYYFKLIVNINKNISLKQRIKYIINKILRRKKEVLDFNIIHGKTNDSFISTKTMPPIEMCKIMACSKSILDTDNKLQCGTTPRLIWALAMNKHIYTTNENIINFPFYNKKYIHIIDRNNPKIDFSYLKDENILSTNSVEYLRLDNWLKNFIK